MKKYYYSEIFYSIQGEGHYTGAPTAWLRYFLCNLQCNGFGQKDPTNPSTYVLPYKDIDPTQYDTMEQLPVFDYGCDSSYSWAKKFKQLQHHNTPEEIADKLVDVIRTKNNPEGKFYTIGKQPIHLCFTGGEPLMSHAQQCTSDILIYMKKEKHDFITNVTFETNGTQPVGDTLFNTVKNRGIFDGEIFFSVSPKLYTVSGEKPNKAIKADVVKQYHDISNKGQLKFVVNNTKESWDELESVVDQFRENGVHYPVWVMNCGGTLEGQQGIRSGHSSEASTAQEALNRGYNYSTRAHVHIFGNLIGT